MTFSRPHHTTLLVLSLSMMLGAVQARGKEQERLFESPRFVGRGNTFVAGYDSDDATRGNPATMAEPDVRFQLRWLQLDGLIGENSIESISDLLNIDPKDTALDMLSTFKDKFGKRQYGRLQGSLFAMRIYSFELTPIASTTNFVDMRLPTTPEVQFRSDTVYGLNLAFALAFGKEFFVGMNVRPLGRLLFDGNMEFADLIDFIEQDDFDLEDVFDSYESTHVPVDVGLIWAPAKSGWRFGFLMENVGYATDVSDSSKPAPAFKQKVSLGTNYRVDLKPWHWDFAFDIQDVVNPEQYNYLRLLHFGTELGRSYISRDHDIGVTMGLNEGYLTYGAFVDLYLTRINLAYYAVELGEYPGQRKDRRWAMTLVSSMTF